VRLARAGEAHAFDQLVERYLRGALAVALEYARDRDDAEDIVQDAFVRTLRELHRFDDRLAFRPWFYTILRNLGRNAAERRARTSTQSISDDTTATHHAADAAADAELRQLIETELAGMTQLQAASFRLCEIEGFNASEVGDMLGIAPATVRTHTHRARMKLREVLTRRGYASPS
jgi:RNA polymerase sigma-70 factor (ECF subfamily)